MCMILLWYVILCYCYSNYAKQYFNIQVLYEFVFAMGEVKQSFKIFEGYPQSEILPSCHNTLEDALIVNGCLMNIEYVDGPHPLDILPVS